MKKCVFEEEESDERRFETRIVMLTFLTRRTSCILQVRLYTPGTLLYSR